MSDSAQSSRRVRAFAHRGGARHPEILGLENTLTAFRHAVSLGYRDLETDVHVCADGVLVAFHDDVLDRVTDRVGRIGECTFAEVQQAAIAAHERVPTLASLLTEFPEARLNIDLKSDRAGEALAALLDEHEAHERVVVGSFSPSRLERFRRLTGGRVATSAHPREVLIYRFSPSAALARWLTPGRPRALQIPHYRSRVKVTTAGLIRRAHRNGLEVHVWTIDEKDEIDTLIDRGVDGIITDRTDILRDVLRNRGLWEDPDE